MKKLLALVCSIVMCVSMIATTALVADAAVDGVTATLEFAGYEVKGTTTFAIVKVKATIPETLIPYKMNAADWETTFEDTYEGKMLQSVGFDIPYIDGLTYVASLSKAASYVQIQDNKAESKYSIYAANTGSYDTYYAGEIDELATLYFRITGDVNAQYDVALTDAVLAFVDVNADGTVSPYSYKFADFTVTDAVVKPETQEPDVNTVVAAETIKTDVVESQEPAGYEKGQGFALRFAAGDVANFTKMIWALTVDGAKKYSDAVAFNAASIADDAQVEVAATFLNQNEAAVSAVNAIFCTEDGTEYFTDAADADNKAE